MYCGRYGKIILTILIQSGALLGVVFYSTGGAEIPSGSNEPTGKASLKTPMVTSNKPHRILEAYPNHIQAQLESRDRSLRNLPDPIDGMSAKFVIRMAERWTPPGKTVKVAFMGGNPALHKEISTVAAEWTRYGNIILDFGIDERTGKYREWFPSDTEFTAEIRISFNQIGYWSCVGTDSNDPVCAGPGEASMNFQGFDFERSADWKAIVLHEFGHALGFEHEHQHPTGGCDLEFRWEDDPGYVPTVDKYDAYILDPKGRRPGIYTRLGGFPNCWSRPKVTFALKQLVSSDSHAFKVGPFDKDSIMKYYFEPWMFKNGERSRCYSKENVILSSEDQRGISEAYPKALKDIDQVVRTQVKVLNALVNAPILAPESKQRYEEQLKSLQKQ